MKQRNGLIVRIVIVDDGVKFVVQFTCAYVIIAVTIALLLIKNGGNNDVQ